MPLRVTSYDVARAAGVSQSAVSRCFTAGASVAPQTRELVLETAARLGYRPNRIAKGLSTRRSGLVAVLVPDVVSLYFPELLAQLGRALERHALRALLFARADEQGGGAVLAEALEHAVDGVVSALTFDEAALQPALEAAVPVVMLNRAAAVASVAGVASDHERAAAKIADLLLDAGHTRPALVTGPADSPTSMLRCRGFCERLRARGGVEPLLHRGDYTYAAGQSAGRRLLRGRSRPDAVFCANDAMAMGLIDAARFELDLRVPDDVSVVGFDDLMAAAWPAYALTTMRQPVRRLTARVAERLAALIAAPGSAAGFDVFACELIRRGSCRLPVAASAGDDRA